jgi:hypothetical protein
MNFTSYKLIAYLKTNPHTAVAFQAVSDRVWCDLVAVLLSSGIDKSVNKTALHYLEQINNLNFDYKPDTHIPVIEEAANWLFTL